MKTLRPYAIRFVQLTLAFLVVLEFVALQADFTNLQTVSLAASIVCASVPLGLALQIRGLHRRRASKVIVHALQTNLSLIAAQLTALVISVAALAAYHIPPASMFLQIIVVQLALYFPVTALAYEPSFPKLAKHKWRASVGFGALAGLFGYANFLFFFNRHDLDPTYIDAALPLYHQAATVTALTILLCSFCWILFDRAHHHERFFTEFLHSNEDLIEGFIAALFVFGIACYTPWLRDVLRMQPLDLVDWASALLAAGLYSLCRLAQRHTRKHSRRAVLQLHLKTKN
jgi:hypothetical protein